MKSFSIDILGRVQNFPLSRKEVLLPLYEAIVNSIHAIEDRRLIDSSFYKGEIYVDIIRNTPEIPLKGMNPETPAVLKVIIKDNGIGFTDDNMNSFLQSDSRYKLLRGGKGIGRFSWLKVYKEANISSVYKEADGIYIRKFTFSLMNNTVDDIPCKTKIAEECGTSIELKNIVDPYKKYMPKNIKEIAQKTIAHCLVYFLSQDCPKITIRDSFNDECFTLNDIFNESILKEKKEEKISILGESLNLLHIKVTSNQGFGNKLYFCANNRLVAEPIELNKHIVDLTKQIYEKNGFFYIGVLTGTFLDDNVDMNRLSFNFPQKDDNSLINEITMDKIVNEACGKVAAYLAEYLEPIFKEKCCVIENYIKEKAPQFRHLLKYKADKINAIPPAITDDKLDDELYKIKREFEKENKIKEVELLDDLKSTRVNDKDYQERFKQQVSQITEVNQSSLAEYVAHRKIIINLLKQALRIQEDDNFVRESYIHNLIYPMSCTGEETNYENHNLWLIDEKLSYCSYIASDTPLNYRDKRPDILILDNPIAVSDEADYGEYNSIIIFELKRPMRDNYNYADNPARQLLEYANKIKGGDAKDKFGRVIRVNPNTKFYLYAICDVTKKLENYLLNMEDYKATPDQMGFFIHKSNINAYIEILPFDKIAKDAEKRNRVLFDKLGI